MPKKVTRTLSDKKVQSYIDGIYEGDIDADNLPQDVYLSIVEYLKAGLYKGWGYDLKQFEKVVEEGKFWDNEDLELLQELRENVYMFGAAKTYQMTKEISKLLIGDDGEARTKEEFNDIARETYDNWNDNWGETEYSTAVGQALSANKWQQIEKEKDVLPNLRYSAIGDACDICMPLDGLTAPVDDHIWNTVSPLNHFNCKCILEQVASEDQKLTPDDEKEELLKNADDKMDKVFMSNPAKDGMIFNEHHPYFEVAKEDRAYAARNFDLPIPDKD